MTTAEVQESYAGAHGSTGGADRGSLKEGRGGRGDDGELEARHCLLPCMRMLKGRKGSYMGNR